MPRVVIISRILTHYRAPFFEGLRHRLAESGVELTLVHGQGNSKEAAKRDQVRLQWAHEIKNISINVFGRELYWQRALQHVKHADLVIVEQANKLLLNYFLLAGQYLGGPPLAFWGHGKNFQAGEGSNVQKAWKRAYSKRAAWWFAYNDLSADVVAKLGFSAQRITSVNNSVDTGELQLALAKASNRKHDILLKLGLTQGPVGIFVGGLYPDKNLPLLLESAKLIRNAVPDFQLVIIGAGEQSHLIKDFARTTEWAHYLGPLFGQDKADALSIANLFLFPGLVGLAILDAFAAGLPVVAVDSPIHSPEIAYLMPGHNGIITANNPQDFATGAIQVLTDEDLQSRVAQGAAESASMFSIERMVDKFSSGIMNALAFVGKGPEA